MKKKRLLAVFAAFTIAATMTVGLTACFDDDDNNDSAGNNTQTEQPDDGNNSNNDNPNNENRKMTEAEWKQAFANSVATESYSLDANCRFVDSRVVNDTVETVITDGVISIYYDGVNGAKYVSEMTYVTDEDTEKYFSYTYYEVSGTDVIEYRLSNNRYSPDGNVPPSDIWIIESRTFDTVEEAKDDGSDDTLVKLITGLKFKVSEESEAKTFADLFSAFTYDEATDTYTANLIPVNMPGTISAFMLKFKDGKVCHIEFEETEEYSDGRTSECLYAFDFTGYNSTVVSVPEEVKANAVEWQ